MSQGHFKCGACGWECYWSSEPVRSCQRCDGSGKLLGELKTDFSKEVENGSTIQATSTDCSTQRR